MVSRAIVKAYESNCLSSESDRDYPQWTENLSTLRSKVRYLFSKTKRNGNWQVYTKKLTLHNKEIRKAKTQHFLLFVNMKLPLQQQLDYIRSKTGRCPLQLWHLGNQTGVTLQSLDLMSTKSKDRYLKKYMLLPIWCKLETDAFEQNKTIYFEHSLLNKNYIQTSRKN